MPEAPLSRERILATAEEVIRRHGPAKATVVDVARALGVSHTAVYRHVPTKTELRNLVVCRWVEATMPPLREIAARATATTRGKRRSAPAAPARLRELYDVLIATKRRRAADDPELFTTYRTLSADAKPVTSAHVAELVELSATIIRGGIEEGAFRKVDPVAAGRALLFATARFHHPAHAAEWSDPGLDATFDAIWTLLMAGLSATPKKRARASRERAPV
jgi:AcrR family transcriptional regulator